MNNQSKQSKVADVPNADTFMMEQCNELVTMLLQKPGIEINTICSIIKEYHFISDAPEEKNLPDS